MWYFITAIILTLIGGYLITEIFLLINKIDDKLLVKVTEVNYKQLTKKKIMEKLPEEWHIKTKNQNEIDTVLKWIQSKGHLTLHDPPTWQLDYKIGQRGTEDYYYDGIHCYGIEISFEDFKRLVLQKEEIPKYVECIKTQSSYGVVGKIYKVRAKNSDDWCVESNIQLGSFKPGDVMYFPLQGFVKPSTKEAYEAQNKPKEPELIVGNLPEINKYITVTCPRYGEGTVMIGLVLTNKREWGSEHLGGQATFLSTFNDQKLFNNHREWSFYKKDENRNWRLSTPDEIKWLEACIKANKFIPKEEALKTEEKFKVGRWVKALKDNAQSSGVLKGDYYRITNVNSNVFSFRNPSNILMGGDLDKLDNWELMPEGFIPPNKENMSYAPIENKWGFETIQIRANRDITPEIIKKEGGCAGNLVLIPKGSITWNQKEKKYDPNYFHPENNRYGANIPKGFFDILDSPNKELSKEELLEICKQKYPIGSIVNSLVEFYPKCKIKEHTNRNSSIKNEVWFVADFEGREVNCKVYKSPSLWAEIISKPAFNTKIIEKRLEDLQKPITTWYHLEYKKETGKSGHQKPIVLKQTKTNFKLLTKNKL